MDHDPPLPRVLNILRIASLAISSVALVTLIAIFGWLVYGRYILNATPTWVEQLALLLIITITFLGAAVGVAENSHLSVEFFREMMPRIIRLILYTIADFLMMVFGGLMAFHGFRLVSFGWGDTIPLLEIPEGSRSIPMVICGALIALFTISRIALRLMGHYRNGGRPAPYDLGVE